MKKALATVGALVLTLLAVTIASGVGKEVGHGVANQMMAPAEASTENPQVALQDGLQKAAESINQQAPTIVDADTTLIGAIAAGDELTYKFRVDREIDSSEQEQLQETKAKEVCGNDKTHSLIQLGAILNYWYTMPSGQDFMVPVRSCA